MLLQIEKLIFGGLGLARTDNGVVLVDQALPGESVAAELSGTQGGLQIYSIYDIIKPSPLRRKPRCSFYGTCGGCDWQHIASDAQSAFKKEIFAESLLRIGKITTVSCIETFPSPEWEYRFRTQLKIDRPGEDVGFYRKKTHTVIPIDHCPLLVKEINTLLRKQRKTVLAVPQSVSQIKVIAGTNNTLASFPVIRGMTQAKTEIEIQGIRFIVYGGSFFQGNRFLLEKLGTWAKPCAQGRFFVDMFGGTGFFSLMLGKAFSGGVLVEGVKEQAEYARRNFSHNGYDHIQTLAMTAEAFCAGFSGKYPSPDCLLVDPPRAGLTKEVRYGIRTMNPRMIVYISCNPSTQARDIGFFVHQCGYSILKAALFDLYPQTHHLETGIILCRK